MPSRNLDVILLDDFNIGAEGVDQVVTLSVTGPLTIVPRTFYLIDNSTAADIVITVDNAGNAGAYAFFGLKKSSTGNASVESASLINGIASQAITANNRGFGVLDTGSTYTIEKETRFANDESSFIETFSAAITFDFENGRTQQVDITGDTTLEVNNEQPGAYGITLVIDSIANPVMTIGASFGKEVNYTPAPLDNDGDRNILILFVQPDGTKSYSIDNITA